MAKVLLMEIDCIECGAGRTPEHPIGEVAGAYDSVADAKAAAESAHLEAVTDPINWMTNDQGVHWWDWASDGVAMVVEVPA